MKLVLIMTIVFTGMARSAFAVESQIWQCQSASGEMVNIETGVLNADEMARLNVKGANFTRYSIGHSLPALLCLETKSCGDTTQTFLDIVPSFTGGQIIRIDGGGPTGPYIFSLVVNTTSHEGRITLLQTEATAIIVGKGLTILEAAKPVYDSTLRSCFKSIAI